MWRRAEVRGDAELAGRGAGQGGAGTPSSRAEVIAETPGAAGTRSRERTGGLRLWAATLCCASGFTAGWSWECRPRVE